MKINRERIAEKLEKISNSLNGQPVIIYAIGANFQAINELFNLRELFNIIGVSDSRFDLTQEGEEFLGYKIIPKENIFKYKPAYVLVAALDYAGIINEFVDQARESDKIKYLPLVSHKCQLSYLAIEKLIDEYEYDTVLDIGCGAGEHSEIFLEAGKAVTAIDYGNSKYFQQNAKKMNVIIADFNQYEFLQQYDCVWCSHLLEHQLNVGFFLKKVFSILREDGILCITIPPMERFVRGGHVNSLNMGLLMYNLIMCGFDCSEAKIKSYGYNNSIIIKKKSIKQSIDLAYDFGDIKKLIEFFPKGLPLIDVKGDYNFDGNILELNWD